MESLRYNLRRYRRQCQWTQKQLAERTGLDVATISALERGRNDPSIQTLLRLAMPLQLTRRELAELIAGRGPMEGALGDLSELLGRLSKPLGDLSNSNEEEAAEAVVP